MYKICHTEASTRRQREMELGLLEAMGSQSYKEITLTALCEQLKVPRKTFYKYFPTKQDCLLALIDHTLAGCNDVALAGWSGGDTLDSHAELRFFQYWKENSVFLDAIRDNDLQNLLNYFNEINITKRREATFNRIKTNTNEKCSEFIDSMKTHSDNLTKTEFYVFKLVCEAIGIEQNFQPSEITETKLTDEDKNLKKEEQISKAIKIIYGPEYQNEKLQMKNCLKNYYDTLIEDIKTENDSYTKKINTYTMLEHIFVIILFSSLLFYCTKITNFKDCMGVSVKKIFQFYRDGFAGMTLGKYLWAIVLIKLFIMFAVLKLFFLFET